MADELTLNVTFAYEDSEDAIVTIQIADLQIDVGTKKFVHVKQNIGTTEEALVLGEVTSLGWGIFINRDTTNYIELRVATNSTKFTKLLAGEWAAFRFGSGITAPYAIANTAACQMEYVIVNT